MRVDGFFLSLSLNKTITQSIMATALSQLEPTLRERPPPMVPLTREHGQRQRSFSTYLVTSNEASEPSSPIRTSSITIHSDREPHSFNRSWHDPHRSIPPSMPTLPECPRAELITTGDSVASSGTFDQEAPSQSSEEECPQSGKHKPSLQFSSLKHTRLPKQKLCRCLSLPSEQPRDKSSPMRLLTSPLHAVASLPDMKIPGRKLKRKATVAQRVDRSPSTDLCESCNINRHLVLSGLTAPSCSDEPAEPASRKRCHAKEEFCFSGAHLPLRSPILLSYTSFAGGLWICTQSSSEFTIIHLALNFLYPCFSPLSSRIQ